jgi:hypothetical protein
MTVAQRFFDAAFVTAREDRVPHRYFAGRYDRWATESIEAAGGTYHPRFGVMFSQHHAWQRSRMDPDWRGPSGGWPTLPFSSFGHHPVYLVSSGTAAASSEPPREVLFTRGRWYAIVRMTEAEDGGTLRIVDHIVEIHPEPAEITWTYLGQIRGEAFGSAFVHACVFHCHEGVVPGGASSLTLAPLVSAADVPCATP